VIELDKAIQIENLKVTFKSKNRRVEAVKGISLTCPSGKKTGIIGESGSGKSLLAMSILQLLPTNAVIDGQCFYKKRNLYKLNRKEISAIRCSDIALIPQNPFESLNPVLTVGRQLVETIRRHDNCSRNQAIQRVKDGLKTFAFKDPERIMSSYSFQLSGGMNQRILSVMGLLCRPNWVIADEPTKGLDAILRKSIYEELQLIAESYTDSVLLITHDLLFAKKFCDYIGVFYRGEMVEWGECRLIFKSPKHPYTHALLASMPQAGMHAIKKNITDQESFESGCSFYAYCTLRTELCKQKQFMRIGHDDHQVRCCRYD